MNTVKTLTHHRTEDTEMTTTLTPIPTTDLPAPDQATSTADTVRCPECGLEAVVEWRTTIGSTDGPLEHLKIRCPDKHWFFMPAYLLP